MYAKLLIASVIGLASFGVAFYLLSRVQGVGGTIPLKAIGAVEVTGFLLNIMLFLISLFSLYVALAAFDYARQAGAEQGASLDASRRALESVVATAQKQQELLDESLKVSAGHFALVKQQREDELRRLAQKPRFEFALGSIAEKELREQQRIRVRADQRGIVEFDFIVKNVGDATARQPVLLVNAQPPTVGVSEHGQARRTANAYLLQIGGLAVMDMPPFQIAKTPYRYSVDAFVPPDVGAFSLTFKMWGDNAPVHEITVQLDVTR